jgi:hypothetical protein
MCVFPRLVPLATWVLDLSLLSVLDLEEIRTRAEGFGAGTSDDGDVEGGFVVKPGEEAVELPVVGVEERVHLPGAGEGDQEDVRVGKGGCYVC